MTETEIAAEIARCHAITGHGPAVQPAQSGVNPIPPQNAGPAAPLRVNLQDVIPTRIAERGFETVVEQRDHVSWLMADNDTLRRQLDAMTAQRDHAVLRMEVAIATSHAWIDAEVRRRSQLLGIPEHMAPAFPASALRQQRQAIGLLSTADAGRVRLGGYAPSLPCPTPRRCPK